MHNNFLVKIQSMIKAEKKLGNSQLLYEVSKEDPFDFNKDVIKQLEPYLKELAKLGYDFYCFSESQNGDVVYYIDIEIN